MRDDQDNVPAAPLTPCLFTIHVFFDRICTIGDDMHKSTPCLGRYHGMTLHDTPCARCHPEVRVPFSRRTLSLTSVLRQVTHRRRVHVLSLETIKKLDKHLHPIFPHSTHPFGGLNIVLIGDPAQLASVRVLPLYAYRAHTAPREARFHHFRTIIELDLDQPFRQTASNDTQTRFHTLFGPTTNCQATEDDWRWLQTCRPTCLSTKENGRFNTSKYIVASNDLRKHLSYEQPASFSPVLDMRACG